jgi:hypothetical protein
MRGPEFKHLFLPSPHSLTKSFNFSASKFLHLLNRITEINPVFYMLGDKISFLLVNKSLCEFSKKKRNTKRPNQIKPKQTKKVQRAIARVI